MAKQIAASAETRTSPAVVSRTLRKFAAPDELGEYVMVIAQSEDEIQGYVEPKDVRALLDAFGLEARRNVVFPFQHIRKQHGEIWRMRLEPAAQQMVEGENVNAHRFLFVRDVPERVGAAQ